MIAADELRARLTRFLADTTRAAEVRVEALRRLAGGASRETWSFDAVWSSGKAETRRALVLRRDPGNTTLHTQRGEEFRVQAAAFADGIPVPEPCWLADPEALGAPAYVMARIDGETLPRRLLRDDAYAGARAVLIEQLGAVLARIHRIDVARHGLGFLAAPPADASPAAAELERYEQIFRGIAPEPHPAFELAFRWLRARLPPSAAARVLVHGDFRIGNVVFGPEGLRAVLDWELAHVGDPAEDIGWFCVRAWRYGADAAPAGGLGSRAALLAAYEAGGGARIDPERVRFWEVFGNLRWAIICIAQTRTHLDGLVRSIELASLGRRTAETEIELLDLIDRP
jgi:aminoglycoside phosphotransferase (APT) family kinase protein